MTTDVPTSATQSSNQPPPADGREHQLVFINVPVADATRSRAFFTNLGYHFDERMCQEGTAHAMIIGPGHYVMLLDTAFFDTFHTGTTAEPNQHEVLVCVSAESREAVDELVDAALAAGGTSVQDQDHGFMYSRSYADLDGHIWEVMFMDMVAANETGAFV